MKHITPEEKKWAKKKAEDLVSTFNKARFPVMGDKKWRLKVATKCALITAREMIEQTSSVVWYEVHHLLEKNKGKISPEKTPKKDPKKHPRK